MTRLWRLLGSAAVVLLALILVGSFVGQPLVVGFVETESMRPTLDAGDGFVALPPQVVGTIQRGDVITYRSEEVQGGRLVTHRVVRGTGDGYVTRGDANAFTDQQTGEPPVERSQIVAVALRINGNIVVIPKLGTAVTGARDTLVTIQYEIAGILGTRSVLGLQGLAYLLFGLSILWYLFDVWREESARARVRERERSTGYSTRRVLALFTLLLVLATTLSMVGPSGQRSIAIHSVSENSATEGGIVAGESTTVPWSLTNTGYVPMVAFVETGSPGVTIAENRVYVPSRGKTTFEVTISAPEVPGRYRRSLTIRRYIAILPSALLEALYSVHPWAPIVVIDALIGIPFYLFGIALVGSGRIRTRSRGRDVPVRTRLRRTIKKLYR